MLMFKKFRTDELFLVEGTKSLDAGKLEFVDDGINFVGRTDENNGVQGKIKKQSFEPNAKNTITATVIGNYKYVKFQETPYYCSQNINKLTPLFDIDKLLALYFCTLISKFTSIWNGQQGGYKLEQLKSYSMVLPVIENPNHNYEYKADDIDWQYMRDYIIGLERDSIAKLEAYLLATGLNDYELTEEDKAILKEKKKILEFSIDSVNSDGIFSVNNTHSILKEWIKKKGKYPYVTASEGNNSVSDYVDFDSALAEKGNCISIGGKTMVVTYQSKDYISNDSHNLALYINDQKGRTEKAQLYMVQAIKNSLSHKYSWNDSISKKKIKDDTVFLPINSEGKPDFDYMEKYIRAIEKVVIADAVKWKDKVIAKTKPSQK